VPAPRESGKSRAPVVVLAVVLAAVGGWVLWDIVRTPPAAPPPDKLKVLGRDDPATIAREAELDKKFSVRAKPSASVSASAAAPPSPSNSAL